MERKIAPYVTAKAKTTYDSSQAIPLTPAVITEMNKLYESVKHLKRRQAVVVQVHASSSPSATPSLEAARLSYSYEKLSGTLLELDQQVQILSRELGFILARGRLAELAVQWSEKSENLSRCGFDSRLLIEGSQWEEWVEGEGKTTLEAGMFGDLPVFKRTAPQQLLGDAILAGEKANADGVITPGEEEEEGDVADSPWCDGRRKCERHFGWQKLCYSEYELNKGTKVSFVQGWISSDSLYRNLLFTAYSTSNKMCKLGWRTFSSIYKRSMLPINLHRFLRPELFALFLCIVLRNMSR
jgi:hypothetical protein